MSTVDKGLEKALNTMRDVISDSMMTHHSATASNSTWVTCNLCNHTGESDRELDHDSSCPIGHVTDLFDDIEYPNLKKENQS